MQLKAGDSIHFSFHIEIAIRAGDHEAAEDLALACEATAKGVRAFTEKTGVFPRRITLSPRPDGSWEVRCETPVEPISHTEIVPG